MSTLEQALAREIETAEDLLATEQKLVDLREILRNAEAVHRKLAALVADNDETILALSLVDDLKALVAQAQRDHADVLVKAMDAHALVKQLRHPDDV